MVKIVIINGAPRSGKDEFVNASRKILDDMKSSTTVINFSTVDTIKQVARSLGWNGITKDEKVRRLLSALKALWIEFNDGPFEEIKLLVDIHKNNNILNNKLIFVHIREPFEIEKVVNEFRDSAATLLIIRSTKQYLTGDNPTDDTCLGNIRDSSKMLVAQPIKSSQQWSNSSDTNVFNYVYDYTVNNSGSLGDLEDSARAFLNDIGVI